MRVFKGDELLFLLLWCSGLHRCQAWRAGGWNFHTSAVSIPCYDAGRCGDHLGAPGMARARQKHATGWLFCPFCLAGGDL